MNNTESGDLDTGSELVVLGWDPADTHTSNFWEQIGDVTAAGGVDSFDVTLDSDKRYLWIQIFTEAESGTINPYLRVGDGSADNGNNYAQRYSTNGGSDSTLTSQSWIALDGVTPATGETTFTNIFVINYSTQEKLMLIHSVESEASGAGNAPSRLETVAKWANTSGQIDTVELQNNAGSGNFSNKSQIRVWGAD